VYSWGIVGGFATWMFCYTADIGNHGYTLKELNWGQNVYKHKNWKS
jgi:hypothetical protein